MKHLLSLAGIEQTDFIRLIDSSCAFERQPFPAVPKLGGRSIGLYFRKTSTRTRTSFAAAAVRLGVHPILFGPGDLQTNTGESLEDTATVLAGYLDALIIRTAGDPQELTRMAHVNRIPVINAMTADEHPTQALSDLAMMKRHFGRLEGLRVLYAGEGNNTAAALALGCSRIEGMQALFHLPPNYGLSDAVMRRAGELGRYFGGRIEVSYEPIRRRTDVGSVDVVYTTRWQTTGTTKSDPCWRDKFAPFRVSSSLMEELAREREVIFMHDLPAVRDEECDAAVLDGPRSIAFEQARQKLFTAMALIEWCVPIA